VHAPPLLYFLVQTRNQLSHARSVPQLLQQQFSMSEITPIAVAPHTQSDEFQLYDLKVEVIVPPDLSHENTPPRLLCGARIGDYFTLEGEMLYLPPGQGISIYSLASVLPLLAAKQRPTSHADWMTTDALVKCPDPNCPSLLKITRIGIRTFRHGETTLVPLQ